MRHNTIHRHPSLAHGWLPRCAALSLAGAALLGGCQNDAGTGAAIGAGLGAVGGAIIGHQSGEAGAGAAIGAAAGGVGGYIIGNESDKKKAEERSRPYYEY